MMIAATRASVAVAAAGARNQGRYKLSSHPSVLIVPSSFLRASSATASLSTVSGPAQSYICSTSPVLISQYQQDHPLRQIPPAQHPHHQRQRRQQQQQQQVRTMVTKKRIHRQQKKKRREELAAKGIEVPKTLPPNYIPRETPVLNAVSKEERDAESRLQDEKAAAFIKTRMLQQQQRQQSQQNTSGPIDDGKGGSAAGAGGGSLRYGFSTNDLNMSDRVRQMLELHNGSQSEVIKAQKHQAMEIFQLREGDTGSSAVQVVALTSRIQQIQTHLSKHKKDVHSKRGLDALYTRRRKLLEYMQRKEFESYRTVVKTLGLVH